MEKLYLAIKPFNIFLFLQLIILIFAKYYEYIVFELNFLCFGILLFLSILLIKAQIKNIFFLSIIFYTFIVSYFLGSISIFFNEGNGNILLETSYYNYAYFLNNSFKEIFLKSFYIVLISMNFFSLGILICNDEKKNQNQPKIKNNKFIFFFYISLISLIISFFINFNYYQNLIFYLILSYGIYAANNYKKIFIIILLISIKFFVVYKFHNILSRWEIALTIIFITVLTFKIFNAKTFIKFFYISVTSFVIFITSLVIVDFSNTDQSKFIYRGGYEKFNFLKKDPLVALILNPIQRADLNSMLINYVAATANYDFLELKSTKDNFNFYLDKLFFENKNFLYQLPSREFYEKIWLNHNIDMSVNPGVIVIMINIMKNLFFIGFFILGIFYGILGKYFIKNNIHLIIFFIIFKRFFLLPDNFTGFSIDLIITLSIIIPCSKMIEKYFLKNEKVI